MINMDFYTSVILSQCNATGYFYSIFYSFKGKVKTNISDSVFPAPVIDIKVNVFCKFI